MRPYRGLTKDGKWVYGNLIVNNAYDLNDGTHKPEPMHTYIRERDYTWVNDPNNKRWTHISYEVIPETVGRYTGLKDIDKTEIYASDKIETPNWGTVAVEWSEEKAMYGFWYTSNWGKSWCSLWKAQGDCKVIGNIHQEVKI